MVVQNSPGGRQINLLYTFFKKDGRLSEGLLME